MIVTYHGLSPTIMMMLGILLPLMLVPLVVQASYCTSGPHTFTVAAGGSRKFTCTGGPCRDCLVHFETAFTPDADHQYFINVLDSSDNYLYEKTTPFVGPESINPALFADATGESNLQVELECDADNPLGSCVGVELTFGFVNCACPDGEYVQTRCRGFDDVVCTTEKPDPPDLTEICFSGDTLVHVQQHHPAAEAEDVVLLRPMKDLHVGDVVLTDHPSEPYQPVYMMAHRDRTVPTAYLQLFTEPLSTTNTTIGSSSTPLEISQDHMVYLANTTTPVPAQSIQVGDRLRTSSSRKEDPEEANNVVVVTQIRQITRPGLYAPLTPHGTIVVTPNKIVASTYVSILPDLLLASQQKTWHPSTVSHIWLSPLRLLCLVGEGTFLANHVCSHNSSSLNEQGMNYVIARGLKVAQWINQHSDDNNWLVGNLLLWVSLMVTGPFRILELVLGPTYWKQNSTTGGGFWPALFVLVGTVAAFTVAHQKSTGHKNTKKKKVV
jgi:hypothetical protein